MVKKLLTMHLCLNLQSLISFHERQKKKVETVLLNAHRMTFQWTRLPGNKVNGRAGKTDANRAQKTPLTKINFNGFNFQRPISDLHQSNSISER